MFGKENLMQTQSRLVVTGVSGHYGRAAANHLLGAPALHLTGTTRTPSHVQDLAEQGLDVRHADFDEPDGLVNAFQGAQRLLLTSTGAEHAGPRRVRQHRHAIDAARAAGVAHIVYTSFLAGSDSPLAAMAGDHVATEQALHASGMRHTVLRHAFYMEMLLPAVRQALASGVIRTLDAEAGVAYVARDDCALAGSHALRTCHGNGVFDVTGPEAITPTPLARMVQACLGVEVKVVELSPDKLLASLLADGVGEPMAKLMVYLERGMAQGAMQSVSQDFRQLTGRQARGVESFLKQHRDRLLARP